ncbi:MAG: hypothetical protein RBG13Loki_0328 [Promethearchaeota archaeon CR_4]|nr:MAG: hypothetical protein RBG13Loki_0328 [Candidatus Lokiarchaeota archaeon CR_4]
MQNLKEFVSYLTSIKEDVSTKLNTQKQALEETLGKLKNQQDVIPIISTLRDQSTRLLDNQAQSIDQQLAKNEVLFDRQISKIENQLGVIQEKIARNLEKLRLGVISKTVQGVVKKIIQGETESIRKNFDTDMKEPFRQMVEGMKKDFENEFGAPFRSLLAQLNDKIQGVTTDAGKIDDDLRNQFTALLSQFNTTLTDASDRIQGISDTVMNAFTELRNTFSKNVIITLDDVLGKVLSRLNMSTKTIEEFWEEAKRVIRVSAKDIWFVRTPEGMKAQIIDAVSRAKMRVLVIAPTLAEIDVQSLVKAPKFINIRIATHVKPEDPVHKQVLETLATHPNIAVRQWELQNLWAINRDFEEVIVGIVSKEVSSETGAFEVAGIGSTLQEHIKIFAGILEDAWVGARKDLAYAGLNIPDTAVVVSTPIPDGTSKRETERGQSQSDSPVSISTAGEKSNSRLSPAPAEGSQETSSNASPAEKEANTAEIIAQIDSFSKKIESAVSAANLVRDLETLRDFIFEKKGFHSVLHDIKTTVSSLRHAAKWDNAAKDDLYSRAETWKEKLLS